MEAGGGKPGLARTSLGNRSGGATLWREQREQLESNHCENRVTGKDGEADYKHHKHIPSKRRMAVRLKAIRDE
jgi:hypothetical protein